MAAVVVEEVGVTTAVVEAAEGEVVESGAPVGAAVVMAAVAKVTTAAAAVTEAALAVVVRGVTVAEEQNLNSRGAAALRLTRAVAGEDMALGTSRAGTSSGVNSKAAGATRAGVSNRTQDMG